MRKPKISDQYDRESFIKGYKKGWGDCLGKVIGFFREHESWGDMWDLDTLTEAVLAKHPYRPLESSAKSDENE